MGTLQRRERPARNKERNKENHAPNTSNTISTGTGTSPVGQDAIPDAENFQGLSVLGLDQFLHASYRHLEA